MKIKYIKDKKRGFLVITSVLLLGVAFVIIFGIIRFTSGNLNLVEKKEFSIQIKNFSRSLLKVITPLLLAEIRDPNSKFYKELYQELIKPEGIFKDKEVTFNLLTEIFFNKKKPPELLAPRQKLLESIFEDYGDLSRLRKLDLVIKIKRNAFSFIPSLYYTNRQEKKGRLYYTLKIQYGRLNYEYHFWEKVKVISNIPDLLGKFTFFVKDALKSNVNQNLSQKRNRFNLFINAPDASKFGGNKANVLVLNNGYYKKDGHAFLFELGGNYNNYKPAALKLRKKIIKEMGWIFLGSLRSGNREPIYLNLTYGKYNINYSEDFLFYMQDPRYIGRPDNPERLYRPKFFNHPYWELRFWDMGTCQLAGTEYEPFFKRFYASHKDNFYSSFLHLFGKPNFVSPTLVFGKVYGAGLRVAGAVLRTDKMSNPPQPKNGVSPPTASDPNSFPYVPLEYCPNKTFYSQIKNYFVADLSGVPGSPLENGYDDYVKCMSKFIFRSFNECVDFVVSGNSTPYPAKMTFPLKFYNLNSENIAYAPAEFLPLKSNRILLDRVLSSDSEIENYIGKKISWDYGERKLDEVLFNQGYAYPRNQYETVLSLGCAIKLKKDIYLDKDLLVERGGYIITEGDIHIKGNIRLKNPDALLVLFTTKGNIIIEGSRPRADIWASLMAPRGTIITKMPITLYGNLLVDHLYFKQGNYLINLAKWGGEIDYNPRLAYIPGDVSYNKMFLISFEGKLHDNEK